MLTLLEPPSPASSARLCEVECSLQTTPQLPGALPMASPPGSYPEKHHDTAESSRVPPVFKRLQTIFKKTKKDQASQPPNQLSTKSGRPVDFRLTSQLQPPADITKGGPSRFAAGKRVRVSVFLFFGRQQVCSISDEASQRVVAKPINLVRCSVWSLVPLFILRDSPRKIPRLPQQVIRSRTRPVADNGRQVQRKRVLCVSFQ